METPSLHPTEQELNEWLLASQKLAQRYYNKKKYNIAEGILRVASDMALIIIGVNNFNAPQICNSCHRKYTHAMEKDMIRQIGVCFTCDKISTELQYE